MQAPDPLIVVWTVVKVKNSYGKVLWIPFDYGIGPAEKLDVSKNQRKYVNTEKKRYALYQKDYLTHQTTRIFRKTILYRISIEIPIGFQLRTVLIG